MTAQRLSRAVPLVLLLFALAACGGTDADQAGPDAEATDGAQPEETTPAGESSPSEEPEEAEASEPAEVVEVTVGAVPVAGVAPLFVAMDQGYFEDENLDVTVEFITSSVDAMGLLSTGQLDVIFAAYSAGFFNALGSGIDMVAVGHGSVQPPADVTPTAAVVVSADRDDLQSGEDLAGRTVATSGGLGSGSTYLMAASLKEHGVTLADIQLEQIGFADMPIALSNGSIDAAFMTDPLLAEGLASGEVRVLVDPVPGTSASGVLYSPQFADSDAGQGFFNAIARALEGHLTGDDWYDDATLETIAEWTDGDVEVLREGSQVYFNEGLAPLPDQLTEMQQMYMDAGVLDYEELIPTEQFVDPSFAEQAS